MMDAVKSLSALAQGSRLSIFRLLVQAGPVGMAAGVIGEALALPPATLSFHLAGLTRAGLLPNLTGVGSAYEVPEHADLVIDSTTSPLPASVSKLMAGLKKIIG